MKNIPPNRALHLFVVESKNPPTLGPVLILYAVCRRRHHLSRMKQIDSTKFDAEVLQSAVPVIVDFYTEECQPCRIVSPLFDQIEKEHAGALKIVKIDAVAEAEFSASFRIMSVPTLLLFRGGERVAQMTGARGMKELQKWIDDSLR